MFWVTKTLIPFILRQFSILEGVDKVNFSPKNPFSGRKRTRCTKVAVFENLNSNRVFWGFCLKYLIIKSCENFVLRLGILNQFIYLTTY